MAYAYDRPCPDAYPFQKRLLTASD